MRRSVHSSAIGFALVLAVLAFSPVISHALNIGFVPSDQTVFVGTEDVAVDLVVSGLDELRALYDPFDPFSYHPSIGAFDIDVTFNTDVLSFAGYALGPSLGDPLVVDPIFGFPQAEDISDGEVGTGVVNVGEVSLLWPDPLTDFLGFGPPYLEELQPGDSVLLATLLFDADEIGVSDLDFGLRILGDGYGADLRPITTAEVGRIEVVNAPAAVPEPATILFLSTGLIGLASLRRRLG